MVMRDDSLGYEADILVFVVNWFDILFRKRIRSELHR